MWVIYAIQIISIISIVFLEHKKPMDALFWVVIVSVFPVVGVIIYLLFGSTLRIKLQYFWRGDELNKRLLGLFKPLIEDSSKLTDLNEVQRENIAFNENYIGSEVTVNNKAEIITSGKQKYEKMFTDMASAKHSINVVYYGIHNDEVGKKFASILAQKAREGVKVRVLCDGLGSFMTRKKMFRDLLKAGGEFRKIKSIFTHFRNHRKIVVVDGTIGYTGGMNIGKKYIGKMRKKSPWRDTQLRLQGDAVYRLQYYFYYDWYYANHRPKISDEDLAKDFPKQEKNTDSILPAQVVVGGVDTDKEAIKLSYMRLISSARKKIVIQTPYFVPDDSFLYTLKVALLSGVEVVMMLPAQKASFFLQPTTNYYIAQLLGYGLKVYKYKGYMHAKTITVDDCVTCIGSVNIDIRSLELDDEICVMFYDKKFTSKHLAVIRDDIERSTPMNVQKFMKRGSLKKIEERIFKLLSPLL